MLNGEIFVPDPKFEADRLLVVENALGEGGLIDQHLSWTDAQDAPSAAISDINYGYLPLRFEGDNAGLRPGREPVEFQSLATDTLGLAYDVEYAVLVDRINEVDSGWFDFLAGVGLLNPDQAQAMKKAANQAYRLDTLTEDNLPTYVSLLLGEYKALAQRYGVAIPATEEWSRGIWTGEEGGHLLTMNEYGKITAILTSLEHSAGRNSQLRAGMDVLLEHVTKLYIYVSWQELSTNYAHARNGTLFGPVGQSLLSRIGQDEAKHHYVYQGVVQELYNHFPDDTVRTLETVLRFPGLDMPGDRGIPDFLKRGVRIHGSAVFGIEHAYQAARSIIQKLGLLDENRATEGLSTEGMLALKEIRERFSSKAVPRRRSAAFVLGDTVKIADLSRARKEYSKQQGLPVKQPDAA